MTSACFNLSKDDALISNCPSILKGAKPCSGFTCQACPPPTNATGSISVVPETFDYSCLCPEHYITASCGNCGPGYFQVQQKEMKSFSFYFQHSATDLLFFFFFLVIHFILFIFRMRPGGSAIWTWPNDFGPMWPPGRWLLALPCFSLWSFASPKEGKERLSLPLGAIFLAQNHSSTIFFFFFFF